MNGPIRWWQGRGWGWPELKVLLLVGIFCGSILGFIAVAEEVSEQEHHAFEEQFLRSLRQPDDPSRPIGPRWLSLAAIDLTSLGSAPVLALMVLLSAGYLVMVQRPGVAALLIVGSAGGAVVAKVLKALYARDRPSIVPHLAEVTSASFPSGHSMASSVIFLLLGALLARVATRRREKIFFISTALALAFLVGITRVYLGVHYPSDVVAGWAAGVAWAIGCWFVAQKLPLWGDEKKSAKIQ